MSILKSTKTGRIAVPLTVTYLINNHWFFDVPEGKCDYDYNKIWKNNKNYLNLVFDKDRHVTSIYMQHETTGFIYSFSLESVLDLDIVEKFWKKLQKGNKCATEFLKKNAKVSVTQNTKTQYTQSVKEYTDEINRRILERLKLETKKYKVKDRVEQAWKSTKNYFAFYFK